MDTKARARTEYQWRNRGIKRSSVLLYDALLTRQKGICQLCSKCPDKRRLILDHNLATGKIRGLLCIICSQAVRQIEHLLGNKARLDQLADYVAADGEPIVSAAESDIENLDTYILNSTIYLRQDRALKMVREELVAGIDRGEAIRNVAAHLGLSTRTIRRYIGLK